MSYALLILLILEIIIYIVTYIPFIHIAYEHVWYLHYIATFGFFSIFFSIIIIKYKFWKKRYKTRLFKAISNTVSDNQKVLVFFTFMFAAINAYILHIVYKISEGVPDYDGQVYTLVNLGKFVREITQDEYFQIRRYKVRLFSGHWIFFTLLPYIFYKNKKLIEQWMDENKLSDQDISNKII